MCLPRSLRPCIPGILLLSLLLPGGVKSATADTASTPSPEVQLTAEPTFAAPTPYPTAPAPTAVTREHGKPVATIYAPIPLATEPQTSSKAPDIVPTAAEVPTPTPSTSGAGPGSVAPSLPPLTPAQLRENARLRWGNGIPATVRQWAFLIVPAARKYGLGPNLIAAVMTMESAGDPLAWNSGSDARGLMQVLHGPWDPKANIFTGARMLREFYDEFGDWTLTLAAYNAGPNAVLSFGGVPPYRETRDYVIVVSYLWDLYSHHHNSLHRKAEFRSTRGDLRHFANERRKLKALAKAAQISGDFSFSCVGSACDPLGQVLPAAPLDPFWPAASAPDPLEQVTPPGSTGYSQP
jgi:soluble lytic murein transglycosylase-like protein